MSRAKVRPARLDVDRKATPLTRIVAHVPPDTKIVGHSRVERYELKDCDCIDCTIAGEPTH